MDLTVKIEGLDKIENATRQVQPGMPVPHNGKQIAALIDIGLIEMRRRRLVPEHGE